MESVLNRSVSMLRLKQVRERTGLGRSTLYDRIKRGAWTTPVSLGSRAVGWPAHEVDALINALISGLPEKNFMDLVRRLEKERLGVSF